MSLDIRRVLVADGISSECSDRLRQAGLEVTETGKLSVDQLIELLQGYDALLVRSATQVTGAVFDGCRRLKLVGRAGTGTDNIDTQVATKHGVIVMNTPGGNTVSAAEHTCVLITALSRQLAAACSSLKDGHWKRSAFVGSELYGKTLAVLGLGRIGRQVAHRMSAFGMKVTGYDPIVTAEAARQFGVEKRELDDIWSDADYVTVHTPLIPQTKHLISADSLSRCKRGVRVVNVARGGIVDEASLLAALESGQCAGAGLDVFAEEPPTDLRLVRHPAVICTPHLGANTGEAQRRVAVELAEQIVSAVTGGPLEGVVNGSGVTEALSPANKPYVTLGKALGVLLSPGLGAKVDKCQLQIITAGREMAERQACLRAGLLVGLLTGHGGEVHLLSAAPLAAELGVTVSLSEHTAGDPGAGGGTVTARLTTADGADTTAVTGTLRGEQATLLELNEAQFETGVTLQGRMMFFQEDGHPNALVELITALAAADARPMSVLASVATSGVTQILAVRLSQEQPQLQQLDHTKLYLQTDF